MTDLGTTLPHQGADLTRGQTIDNIKHLVTRPLDEVRSYQDFLKTEIGYLIYRSENHESAAARKKAAADLKVAEARFEMTVDAVLIAIL